MMKRMMLILVLAGGAVLAASLTLTEANPWDSNMTHQVVWGTKPGMRYELQESGSLSTDWDTVTGYPTQAVQYADAHAFNISSNAGNAHFFKVLEYDEQPPAISGLAPDDGAFAVTRYNTVISVSLTDASGVDSNSIVMTVGDLGTFAVTDTQLSYASGVLTFDMGDDTALGSYGTNVQVSLIVADINGYAVTNGWTFDLELQADVSTNLFVFGSPDAQRSGQKIGNIPTRVLAERVAGGPIRMSGAYHWELHEVATNRVVILYTGAIAPSFNVDEYLANLTPATVDEIFYRKVTGLSDDPSNKLLTLYTQDVLLTDIVDEGTAAMTENSMVLEVSADGTIISARAVQNAWKETVTIPRIGYSLDGQTFSVSDGGSVGLEIMAEECHFWLSPRLETSVEIKLFGGLKRFSSIARGDIDSALICNVTAQAGATYNKTIFDLPTSAQPRIFVTLGSIGPVPVIAEVGVDLKLDVDMYGDASMNFRYGFRQEIETAFGVRYVKGNDLEWVKDFIPAETDRIPFTSAINGELGLGLTLRPSVYVIVYKLAGIETGPAVRGGVRFESDGPELAGYLEGRADWELGLAGPAFESLGTEPLSLNIWEPQTWKLFPDADSLTFIQQPSNQVVEVGGSATFSCSVSPDQGVEYQWFQNNVPQKDETKRTLLRHPVTDGHAGTYWVVASAGGETVISEHATLNDSSPPSGMVRILGGTNSGTAPDFGAYSLTVSSFYMDETEVSKALWDAVYTWAVANGYSFENSGLGKAPSHPVHTVNWYDCVKWCSARSEMDGRTPCYTVGGNIYKTGSSIPDFNPNADGYCLPTKTEWEYAARGGLSGKRFPWGDTINHSRANYKANGSAYSYDTSSYTSYTFHPSYDFGGYPYTSPTGSFPPNGYCLYDMVGNLEEWCWDAEGGGRVYRDASWWYSGGARNARCGFLYRRGPFDESYRLGFRSVYH